MKYSIIVPVYNSEKYINRCLESLSNQTYQNIEIIIVNDGSNDGSLELITKFQEKDPRIKIITQKNLGVSFARNKGIKESSGDYILFVDSDDYIDINTIEKCNKIITDKKVDILGFSYYKRINRIKKTYKLQVPTEQIINKATYKDNLYRYIMNTNDFCNVTTKIIKADIAKSVNFDSSLVIAEDFLYFVQCFVKSNSIYFTNKEFYNYMYNPESVTHYFDIEKNISKLINSITSFEKIKRIIKITDYIENTPSKKEISLIASYLIEGVKKLNYNDFCAYIDIMSICKSNVCGRRIWKSKKNINPFLIL